MIKKLLSEPLSRGLDLDDPALTGARRQILRRKKFLRALYAEWYSLLSKEIPSGHGAVLELGSGSGFAQEQISNLITSEIFWLPEISLVTDGCKLPFARNTLKAVLMTDVLHHIPDARAFFAETNRCLLPGGVVAMIEPWVSPWSSLIYRRFHHEPFEPDSPTWEFRTSGPLSGANGALPWIVFQRDRSLFTAEFPRLKIEKIMPMMPFSYLASGGLSMRGLLPGSAYPICRSVENLFAPWNAKLAMFVLIVLRVFP